MPGAQFKPHIWLRAETKPQEQRTALPPEAAKSLLDAGFTVTVEDGPQNIFPLTAYREAGCAITAPGSWTKAPIEAFILGLKELPEADFPLVHSHIYFAHAYKGQAGADAILRRFTHGGGTLFDLEFLLDDNGRRVAAFGYWAGFAGAALAVQAWANKKAGASSPLGTVHAQPDEGALISAIKSGLENLDHTPTLHVIGAKGRSGTGACAVAEKLGLPLVAWDMAETHKGGPFPELNDADVFVNCVLLGAAMPPFLTKESLSAPDRKLSVIADVSCDPTSPHNPLPIYDQCTTFAEPCLEIEGAGSPLHMIAIDHLPSLLPKESSEDYASQLLPHLRTLDNSSGNVWVRAGDLFLQNTETLRIAS